MVIHRHQGIEGVVSGDYSHCRVLLLEPQVRHSRLLSIMMVQDMGVGACDRVSSVGEAAKTLMRGEHNVLMADWSPACDVLKLLRGLRSAKSVDRLLPVIVMVPQVNADMVQQMRDAGGDEILCKPFSRRMLESRLKTIATMGRVFVEVGTYFGPDRRRFATTFDGQERRRQAASMQAAQDRRANNVRTRIEDLRGVCGRLDVPQLLALRRLTLAQPQFQDRHYGDDLDDFFALQLTTKLDRFSFERLEAFAKDEYNALLPDPTADYAPEDRQIVAQLARHMLEVDEEEFATG